MWRGLLGLSCMRVDGWWLVEVMMFDELDFILGCVIVLCLHVISELVFDICSKKNKKGDK
jgi:hypothetical protein